MFLDSEGPCICANCTVLSIGYPAVMGRAYCFYVCVLALWCANSFRAQTLSYDLWYLPQSYLYLIQGLSKSIKTTFKYQSDKWP